MMMKRMMILALLLGSGLLGCNKSYNVEEFAGSWKGNVFFPDQSKTELLELKLNKENEYSLKMTDTGQSVLSSGEFRLQDGKITFNPSYIRDTSRTSMLTGLNNRPVKLLHVNETSGLQIKMNDMWHYLEKTN